MHRLAKSAVLVAVLAGFAANAPLAGAQLSLSAAVDLALRNDPRVRMAEFDVKKAEATVSEAHSAFIPSLSADGGYGKSIGAPLGLPTVFSVNGQSLVFNFSQRDNIRAASTGLQAARLTLKDTRDAVAEDMIDTYISLAQEQQKQAAMQEELTHASRLQQIVSDRLTAGQDTQMELLRARREVAQVRLAIILGSDQIDMLTDHLTRAMGIADKPLQAVAESIPEVPERGVFAISTAVSPGIDAAFANAKSKQEIAFGAERYLLRPQITMTGYYSRLNTSPSQSNFLDYYPTFRGQTNNEAAIALQIQIPILDRARSARAHEASADAAHAFYEAQSQRNLFLEGRAKLDRAAAELKARAEVLQLDQQIAQEQLNSILIQLNSSSDSGRTQLSPKDEQNARLEERQKYVELLDAQLELRKTEVSLMRQMGTLEDWLRLAVSTPVISASH